ncbi:MAG TPA: hypothetical protein VFG05_02730 [Methylocella sp.]|nr:hypothetical protein [Methylocella sp.]
MTFLVLAVAQTSVGPALAEIQSPKPAGFSAPLPPARPIEPDARQPETSPAFPASPAAPIDQEPPLPRVLPQASRARMHACGLEWQKMKETGAASGKTWYEFATVCLTK